jgi:hypothetical protein
LCSVGGVELVFGWRRGAADRDGLAPGQQVQRAPYGIRQQNGPCGRRFPACR